MTGLLATEPPTVPRLRGTVLGRQLPTLVAFAIASAIIAIAPATYLLDSGPVLAGAVIVVVATLLALVLDRFAVESRSPASAAWVMTVPVLSLLAIGLLRVGTGGPGSLFTPMLILPVVWIATGQGRRYVVLAALGTAAALLLPYALVGPGRNDPLAPWRAVVGPLVYAFLAVTINWLSARIRDQVTVLRASEERLRAADRLTRSVLDAVTEQAVIGTDLAGLVDVWNPGAVAMLGLDPAQAQGLPIEGLVLPAELERRRSRVDGATAFAALVDKVAPGRADVAEWTWVRADGSTLPVVVAITARQDETGATVGYIFVATDHTAVREAAREQDHFFGMVSHELRTPLAAVLGHLELLRDDPLTDDQRHHMAVAERNAHRLLRLVNDLLLAAQVDAGGFPLEITDVDLAAVVAASAQSAGPAADLADVRLVVEVSPDVTSVPGDAGRLGQVCDNLVSNAIKFTPAGGTVTVRLRNEKDEVRLSVSDTGIGIPAGEVDQLFGRFFRASSAVATAVPGVGLGLAITRAIVAAHHGTVRVTSVEGGGTTFTVCLPVLLAEDFAAPDAAHPAGGE